MSTTAAEEERLRRKAAGEAAKMREIYEEMVLKKKPDALVQIGWPVGAGKGNGDGNGADAEQEELVRVK